MSIIRTDQWLELFYEQPIELCKKIRGYFNEAPAYEIYEYLKLHGMYLPIYSGIEHVNKLKENKV